MRDKIVRAVRTNRAVAVILTAFVALAAIYSIVTPIFEAGDELWHYPFVQHLATGHALPVQDPNVKTLWEQEGGQPPLYYALGALTTFWIDTRDLPDRLWRNPEAKIGIPLVFGNKNMVVHTSVEDFPWHNTALAVHLIRFLSILFSAFTILFTYLLVLEIKPDDKTLATLAAALVAFNPMFLFISASVNNDNLAIMLATLSLLLLAHLVTRGATTRQFVAFGVVLGLAALSKVSDLGLLVVAAVVFSYLLWRAWKMRVGEGETRSTPASPHPHTPTLPLGVVTGSLLCAAIVVAIAGWWYVRNWQLYNDPFAFNVWVAIAGGRPAPATLAGLVNEFQGFRISYWGNFGGVNIIAPDWVYVLLDAFTVVAVIGLLIGVARRALPRLLALPAAWLALILILLVRWTLLTLASQGRLIFPAISAVAILMALGLGQFGIRNSEFKIRGMEFRISNFGFLSFPFVIFLFAFSALTPLTLLAPAYALPARLPSDASVPNPTLIAFEDQAELVGYALPQKSVAPGGELPLTVYWRARSRIAEDFSVYIRLFDATGKIVGRWEAFPGGGLYPTRLWQPGEIVVDTYRVPLAPDARGPGVGRIEVGLFRRVPLENLTARDPQGRVVTPTIARFKIAGESSVQVQGARETTNFGDRIALVGSVYPQSVAAGSTLSVTLYWRALAAMTEDYTVFVHLVDANGKTVAQKDAQPQNGAYPTSFWDVGETIADEYALAVPRDLAPGDYRIEIGIYRASDDARLPIRNGGDALGLGAVRVMQ